MSVTIALSNGMEVMVDEQDFAVMSSYSWYGHKDHSCWYAVRCKGRNGKLLMHREIIGSSCAGLMVDHINGNGLDNRRENLRVVTAFGNARNRKPSAGKPKGVYKRGSKFEVSIRANHKLHYLGMFSTQDEAIAEYNKAATLLHGEHARLNTARAKLGEI